MKQTIGSIVSIGGLIGVIWISIPGWFWICWIIRGRYRCEHRWLGSDSDITSRPHCGISGLSVWIVHKDAIHRKNNIAQANRIQCAIYMSAIGALCSILGILMLIRFPSYIVDPIQELIRRIKEIANQNYDQTLEFHTGDEYEELAEAFNRMVGKLQEYENSSLDRIRSEKKRVEAIINHIGDAVIGLDADN